MGGSNCKTMRFAKILVFSFNRTMILSSYNMLNPSNRSSKLYTVLDYSTYYTYNPVQYAASLEDFYQSHLTKQIDEDIEAWIEPARRAICR